MLHVIHCGSCFNGKGDSFSHRERKDFINDLNMEFPSEVDNNILLPKYRTEDFRFAVKLML